MFADSFERLLQMQRKNSEEQLKFGTLKGRKESFDKLKERIQQIPKADMSNMQGIPSGFNTIPDTIPGMAIGNMQGLITGGIQTNQPFPMIKQKIPAMTLDGGKTYFDPRDGSSIDINSLQPKDFFFTPGY